MKQTTKLSFSLIFLFFVFTMFNCNRTPYDPTTETAPVKLMISTANAPSEVSSITGELSRSGFETVTSEFVISNDSATASFGEIAVGTWHLVVTAYSGSMDPLYQGETDVNISGGTTNMVYLTLEPTTGALQVVVTWGGEDLDNSGDFIYMHTSYSYSEGYVVGKALFRYNVQSGELEQMPLTGEPGYPVKISGTNKLGFISRSTGTFYLSDPDGHNPESLFNLPEQMMGLDFSANTEELFYYTWSGYGNRQLKKLNYPDPNTITALTTGEFDDAAPVVNANGDSILFQSSRSGNRNVYLMDSNSNEIQALTEYQTERAGLPEWSTHSNGFYYQVRSENANNGNIIYQSFSTGTTEILFSTQQMFITAFDISPDETQLAIVGAQSYSQPNSRDLYIYNLSTEELTRVTNDGYYFGRPHWFHFE